jgi:hypothetical protein
VLDSSAFTGVLWPFSVRILSQFSPRLGAPTHAHSEHAHSCPPHDEQRRLPRLPPSSPCTLPGRRLHGPAHAAVAFTHPAVACWPRSPCPSLADVAACTDAVVGCSFTRMQPSGAAHVPPLSLSLPHVSLATSLTLPPSRSHRVPTATPSLSSLSWFLQLSVREPEFCPSTLSYACHCLSAPAVNLAPRLLAVSPLRLSHLPTAAA